MAEDTAVKILRAQFKFAHEWLEGTMQGVTDEVAHWLPPGEPAMIGAEYAHTLVTEDFLVNAAVRGAAPLMMTSFADKTGFPLPPQGDWKEWGRSVQVDLAAARAYAQAVYAATDAYLATLTDADICEEIDARELGLGQSPRWDVLSIVLLDLHAHSGEIAVLKGLQGLRGYPV